MQRASRWRRMDVTMLVAVMALTAVASWWGMRGAREGGASPSPSPSRRVSVEVMPQPGDEAGADKPWYRTRVVFSADGRWLACSRESVCIYDVATGALRQRIRGCMKVSELAFSPDGRLLAVLESARVSVWEVASARLVTQVRTDRRGDDGSLAWHPCGRLLAYSRGDLIELSEMPGGRAVASVAGHACAFSPGGTLVTQKGMWRVAEDGKMSLLQVLPEIQGSPWCVLPGESGRCLVLDHVLGIRLVPWKEADAARLTSQRPYGLVSCSFSLDTRFYLASDFSPMHLVEASTGHTMRVFNAHADVVLSPQGDVAAGARAWGEEKKGDPEVELWKIPEARLVRVMGPTSQGVAEALREIATRPDGGLARPESLGPFVLGTTRVQEMRALLSPGRDAGAPQEWYDPVHHVTLSTRVPSAVEGSCWSFTLRRAWVRPEGAVVTAVPLDGFATHLGVRLGTREEEVWRLYPRAREHAQYVPAGYPKEAYAGFTVRNHRVEEIYLTLIST